MIIILKLKMPKVFGIWNTKKYLEKYLNADKLTCIWYYIQIPVFEYLTQHWQYSQWTITVITKLLYKSIISPWRFSPVLYNISNIQLICILLNAAGIYHSHTWYIYIYRTLWQRVPASTWLRSCHCCKNVFWRGIHLLDSS